MLILREVLENRTIFISEMSTPKKETCRGIRTFLVHVINLRVRGSLGCIGALGVGIERDPGTLF